MAHNTIKLLGATTALLALISTAATAQTVINTSATVTTSTSTDGVAGGFVVSSSSVVSAAAIPTFLISGTTAENIIVVNTGSTVQNTSVSATILGSDDMDLTQNVSLTNAGTIRNLGAGNAISLSALTTGAVSLGNSGTISGAVALGAGDDVITNSGTINGAVSTGAGADAITNTGTITGDVALGAGNNTLTVSGSTASVVGNITAGANNDTLNISNSLVNGTVNLGDGTNAITLDGSNAKISGTLTTTGGADTLTLRGGATVAGAVVLGAGANTISATNSTFGAGITGGANVDTVLIAGTNVGGAINLGAGHNVYTQTNGTVNGNLTATTGDDTVTLNGARINGNVDLGAGNNTVTTSNNAIISGTFTTAGGNDTITFGSGTIISGTAAFGDGANTVTATGTTFRGNVSGGGGADKFYLINSSVSGTMGFGGGTDDLFISGTTAFATKGAITGLENLNVSTTQVTLDHSVIDAATTNVRLKDATLNVNVTQTGSTADIVANNSTINIAAGKVLNAGTAAFSNGGVLGVHVASSVTAGKLQLTGALTGVSATIRLASDAGYINSGTTFQIVKAGAPSVLPSLTTTTHGLYTFSLADDGDNGVSLTILRQAANAAATNTANAAVGNVMEGISSTTNTQLLAVQSALSNASSNAEVNNVLESLLPAGGTGAVMANVNVANSTGNQVSNRLAMLRGTSLNTGDGMFANHFWIQGFGSQGEQDTKKAVKGYDTTAYGTSVGMDTDTLVDGMNVGAAFSYGQADVKSKATGGAKTDVDSYMLTLYGSKTMDTGVFVNGQANLGMNKYETRRLVSGVGQANGDFDGTQYGLKAEVGRDYDYEAWTFTPLASAQLTHVDMDGYTETGAGGAGLVVNSTDFTALDLGLGANVAWNMPLHNGGMLKPSLRAKYVYRTGDDTVETTSRFVGGGASFTTNGVKADRSSLNLGAGLLLSTVGGVNISADYDAGIRSSYTGHTGQLKARWAF